MPRIPEEGSPGSASGDLTPLSYAVAATLIGERDVIYKGEVCLTAEVFNVSLVLQSIQLRPKEGLALMNGTSVMTALACLAYKRAEYLAQMGNQDHREWCLVGDAR